MKHARALLAVSALIAACASGPPVPDWESNAKISMDHAVAAYLAGDTRLADSDFERARSEITRTGRIQRRELIAGPLQRRVDLATVQVSVASGLVGGHYALPHADHEDAEQLMAALGGPRHDVAIRKVPAPVGT